MLKHSGESPVMKTSVITSLLGYRLAQASIPAFSVFDDAVGTPFSLRRVDFAILALLSSNAHVTLTNLCRELRSSTPRLSLVVDRLVKRGLVQRIPNDQDRRVQFLVLTAEGVAITEKALAAASKMEAELMGRLSPAERATLFRLLTRLSEFPKQPS
ncbi:MarR family transcriptional regulator [uncultured Pseudacidovorax sp.]|uniref:MarR family winged helix-turn-helix transcriptional regulator n=1 Tax=uncultured Pseudacidovorax sp. TaxID=679313 RepID=UPI0025F67AE8|nr:MarR family transcriptional regulator [uncultured Pseudacidovorax sp.]